MLPLSFTAELAQHAQWLTGRTAELGRSGDARGLTISASLQGRRDGSHVSWLKTYDRVWRTYDAVSYEGAVNDDGTEISGRWTVPLSWSGTFLMIRQPSKQAARAREDEARR